MILPTKGLTADRCLLGLGAQLLELLDEPSTVSALWTNLQSRRLEQGYSTTVTYDWFVLALDCLFLGGVIDRSPSGLIIRRSV